MAKHDRPARLSDLHDIATTMPFTTREGPADRPVYQVGGKSFVFFRTPRPDALDDNGERMSDVIVVWVAAEAEKQSLVQDRTSPFFTTPHFDNHLSVLLRARDIRLLTVAELTEVVQDAWLSRASRTRANDWLRSHGHAGQLAPRSPAPPPPTA